MSQPTEDQAQCLPLGQPIGAEDSGSQSPPHQEDLPDWSHEQFQPTLAGYTQDRVGLKERPATPTKSVILNPESPILIKEYTFNYIRYKVYS